MIQMDDLAIKVCILLIVQLLLIIALSYICGIFSLNGKFINFISKNNNFEILIKLILFSIIFIFISFIFYYFFNSFGLQILNFILAFILIFEVCIKIAYSDRFINWIGESLDNSIRILIMFIISLNCTYFFTRITHEIIISNTI